MSSISGNFTSYSSFKNEDLNNNQAEDVEGSGISGSETLDSAQQKSILSQFLDDFNGFKEEEASDQTFFSKTNEETGETEYLRVVTDSEGKTKIIHTTSNNDSDSGETEVFAITAGDKLNNWNSNDNMDAYCAGEEIDDFAMFDYDKETYINDIKNFAQEYINKYDSDGNGVLSFEEYSEMLSEGFDEEYNDAFNTAYQTLFEDFQMDSDKESISADELASQFLISDIDWDNLGDKDYLDGVDGKLNFVAYNTIAADPSLEGYDNTVDARKFLYNKYIAEDNQ